MSLSNSNYNDVLLGALSYILTLSLLNTPSKAQGMFRYKLCVNFDNSSSSSSVPSIETFLTVYSDGSVNLLLQTQGTAGVQTVYDEQIGTLSPKGNFLPSDSIQDLVSPLLKSLCKKLPTTQEFFKNLNTQQVTSQLIKGVSIGECRSDNPNNCNCQKSSLLSSDISNFETQFRNSCSTLISSNNGSA